MAKRIQRNDDFDPRTRPLVNRRRFMKIAGAAMGYLALRAAPVQAEHLDPPGSILDLYTSNAAPEPWGRIISWWSQAVRVAPHPDAKAVSWKAHDEVFRLHATVTGKAPWPSNPIWYYTREGFIHSGYVQPVRYDRQEEVIREVPDPGFWVEVSVPYAEARWSPDSAYVTRKLYYQTVYRVVAAVEDQQGAWWYRLQEGISWGPGPYVPAWSVRRLTPADLQPISRAQADKRIEVYIHDQVLLCFEGDEMVFNTPIASGVHGTDTPLGEFHVLYKRYTRRMVGADYDLAGVPYPVYITQNGVAIHGTYWHNDYGQRHSHGCLNIPSSAARWIFRWVDPVANYTQYTHQADPGEGTPVVVRF
ncbi:MAG: L,D-transpeptidase [Anaerolineae bacterium]|nr:L,D-transpeptidase [Anaerolineae bacterium]